MFAKCRFLVCKLWVFFLPNILAAQTIIDIGRFEEDLRITNFLPSSGLGTSLASGDVNGDGVDDLISGALATELFYTAGGAAFLIPGRTELPRFIDLAKTNNRVAFWGNGTQDYTGFLVDIFDFSGDGLADVFITAPQYFTNVHQKKGKIYFIQGRNNWPGEIFLQNYPADGYSATLHGEQPQTQLGKYLAHGDFNGDGITDMAALSHFANRPGPLLQQKTVYILWGGNSLVNGPIDSSAFVHCAIIPVPEKQSPMALFATNLDGDAYDDLIVTFPQTTWAGAENGSAGFILWGKQNWPDTIDLSQWQSLNELTHLINPRPVIVMSRLTTGDYDGSGVKDLAIRTGVVGQEPDEVYIYRDAFKNRPKEFNLFDPAYHPIVISDGHLFDDNFAYQFATLDWNADGFDDLAISNSHVFRDVKRISEGVVYVVYGSAQLPLTIDLKTPNAKWDIIWGGSENAEIGHEMIKADLNADGKDDLVLGAWTATTKGGVASGEIYVLLNRATKSNQPAPTRSALLPISPNPFQNITVIWFELSQPENVVLEIYDILGRRVRLLRDDVLSPGTYSALWNGLDEQGNLLASGVYFVVLRMGVEVHKQKLLLLR